MKPPALKHRRVGADGAPSPTTPMKVMLPVPPVPQPRCEPEDPTITYHRLPAFQIYTKNASQE